MLSVAGGDGGPCEMNAEGTMLRTEHDPSTSVRMNLEGITIMPNPKLPNGGTFLVASRATTQYFREIISRIG
jgi:hypothetical protein